MEILETDYLVVGTGAMGMAFADTLVAESGADVVMIDRHDRPGGHWNDAYPFVRLHTPSAFYGVASRPLGQDRILTSGPSAGMYELASADEIRTYYDEVMREALVGSGRVRYFPMHEYRGDFGSEHHFVSLLSGARRRVVVRKKIIDATYTNTEVATTHPPRFPIASGVPWVPVHELATLGHAYRRYVVIGAGKTGVDACLWLLERGVSPDAIRWIRPRDAWFQDRAHLQPGTLALGTVSSFARTVETIAHAETVDDLFDRLGAAKQLLRIDESVSPTMYRCATISERELELLRSIRDVVRLGRVTRIDADQITLERGALPVSEGELFVYAAASGIHQRPPRPVFTETTITLQNLRWCMPVFSAALIAHLESMPGETAEKNALSLPIPYPQRDRDFVRVFLANLQNDLACRSNPEVRRWSNACRLNPAYHTAAAAKPNDEWQDAAERLKRHALQAMSRLIQFQAQLERAD